MVDLSLWSQAALLIFSAVFIAVAIRTLRQPGATTQRHARVVLEDDTP